MIAGIIIQTILFQIKFNKILISMKVKSKEKNIVIKIKLIIIIIIQKMEIINKNFLNEFLFLKFKIFVFDFKNLNFFLI